jgi:hypothetical protein
MYSILDIIDMHSMRLSHRRKPVLMLCLAASIIAFPIIAGAESVLWTHVYSKTNLYSPVPLSMSDGGKAYPYFFSNPTVRVEYRAHMEYADTGEVIPSGSTVPQGTRVRFEFEPHVFSDISWFAASGSYDTPYGDWMIAASAPAVACKEKDFVSKDKRKKYQGDLYVALAMDPPAKSLKGLEGLDCDAPAANGTRVCTMDAEGTYDPVFVFGDASTVGIPVISGGAQTGTTPTPVSGTYGYFYPRFKSTSGFCTGYNLPATSGNKNNVGRGNAFTVMPSIQQIPMVIKVAPIEGEKPTAPSVVAGAACAAGTPFALALSADDPDGDPVRYGIDWNNDGSVDQYAPLSGYVAAGTPQTVTRTYSLGGSKTVRVLAQDSKGANSGWTSFSFECAQPDAAVAALIGDAQGVLDGPGVAGVSAAPDLTLRATPSLVQRGKTTQIHWSAANVVACTVRGTNGDSWDGLSSPVGGQTSSAIDGEKVYTLSCRDRGGNMHEKSVRVNIIPIFREQ